MLRRTDFSYVHACLCLLLLLLPGLAGAAWADEPAVEFNRQIRRILSDKCFACHGPDTRNRQADLRLDIREMATAARDGGAAIVAGRPDQSALVARVLSEDEDVRMPPAASGERLTAQEIALLRDWIAQGAQYQGHWAFLPLAHRSPPTSQSAPAGGNGIDGFIQHRLDELGLSLSPPANKSTLIRRAYLDVIGLLPSPQDVQQFLDDPRPQAYEELVDGLLRSPHYGERWGRHWLDQARYADSNGYTIDGERVMWPYRDWVIKALNDDLPFDQFTIHQIAGDLLPTPTKRQLVASGFHRNTLINQEGGTDPEQFRMEAVMDRVATTGAVWLGLTVGCAQCHSHKFDPISHSEYYKFLAFFNHDADVNNVGPTVEVHEGEMFLEDSDAERLTELRQAMAVADKLHAQRDQRQQAWEATVLADSPGKRSPRQLAWTPLQVSDAKAEKAVLTTLDDGSVLATQGVLREIYVVETQPLPPDTTIGSIQLRAIPHESLPQQGPGLAGNGNFVLTAVEVYLGDERLPLVSASSSHAQPDYPVTALIDDDPGTGWAINVAPGSSQIMNAEHTAWLALGRLVVCDGRPLRFVLKHELSNDYNLGRFQLSWCNDVVDATTDPGLLDALSTPVDQRTKQQQQTLETAFSAVDQVYKEARGRVDALRRAAGLGPAAKTMVMAELPQRRPTYVLTRGDFLRPDKDAGSLEPDVFSVLPGLDEQAPNRPRTRLDLARWLVRPANPLTPRVTVNRMWMHYFGRGLVETENDFGSQGSPPTHPELLDWLAEQFVSSGWSQKAVHRLILTSAVYRQSSHTREDLAAVDPLNQLLARQNRIRLDAEIVRDAALSASGKLNGKIGGPSVQPPQPAGVYAFTQNRKNWRTATGDDRFRRGMYTMFYRSAPYPTLTTFDAPDFQSVCTRRPRSNTPLQALTMANDQAMFEFAQSFAARILANQTLGAEATERIREAYLIAYAREPLPQEAAAVASFLERQRQRYTLHVPAARQLTEGIDAPAHQLAEYAAWTALARALINTDEFITRE